MAIIAQKGAVATLMRKTIERQEELARMKFKVKPNQVRKILESYVTNKTGPLEDLLSVMKKYPFEGDNFRYLVEDCIECIVLLDCNMKKFVNAILGIDWVSKDPQNVQLYSKFVIDLVTAHTYHAPVVMTSLITCFKGEGEENWEDSPPEELIVKWSYIHSLIAHVVAVMPMTSDILMQAIIDHFPYFKSGVYPNRAYIHNLIWITKYIPSLQEQIITAVINRLVIMDVNIVDRSKNKQQEVFSMDIDEEDTSLNSALDYCILEILQWLQEERNPALNVMCSVFEKIILPTYGIRHVQFLILFTISTSQQCADRVLRNLWLNAAGLHGLGPAALTTRRTAASHLAGLLARCVRVPNSRLVSYLKEMADWCHSYITAAQEATSSATDNLKVHGAFYGVCHAIFYLVAFKHQHLFMNKESINFVESLNLPRLVTCHLNPLKPCPPQVAAAFSSVTRSHQLVYCQGIIEKNSRHSLQTQETVEHWFPYDPYTLPVSGKIIWPLCTEYKDWLQSGDDESQLTTRMKVVSEEDDFLMSTTPSNRLASSLSHCISPGFKSM